MSPGFSTRLRSPFIGGTDTSSAPDRVWFRYLPAVGIVCLALGCGAASEESATVEPIAASGVSQSEDWLTAPPELPVAVSLDRDKPTLISGFGGQLSAQLEAATEDEIVVRIVNATQTMVIGPVRLPASERRTTLIGHRRYQLSWTPSAENASAREAVVLTLDAAPASSGRMSEPDKVIRLLRSFSRLEQATVIRNGQRMPPTVAADHLRRKYFHIGRGDSTKRIWFARDFIDEVGSQSSFTGETYRIRYTNGGTQTVREYLLEQLHQIEAAS